MRKIEGLGPRQSCSCRWQAGRWERPERGRRADLRVGSGPSAVLGGGSAQGYHPNSKPSSSSFLLMVPFPQLNLPHPEPSPLPTNSPSIPALCPPHPNPRPQGCPTTGPAEPTPTRATLSTGWAAQGAALCVLSTGPGAKYVPRKNGLNRIQMKWNVAGNQEERDGEFKGPESQRLWDRNGGGAARHGTRGQRDRDGQTGMEQRASGTGRWETDRGAERNGELNG